VSSLVIEVSDYNELNELIAYTNLFYRILRT